MTVDSGLGCLRQILVGGGGFSWFISASSGSADKREPNSKRCRFRTLVFIAPCTARHRFLFVTRLGDLMCIKCVEVLILRIRPPF
jgi:hypothetical protein